jgi:hypothetical protein
MLFRNKDGKLEEMNLYDFKNDITYYTKLKSIKKMSSEYLNENHTSNCSVLKIISLIEETTNHR